MPARPESIPYAPRDSALRGRRWAVRLLIVLCLVVAGIGLYRQRDAISLRSQRLYWGWQCGRHVVPQGTVLFETDPVRAAALLATNPDYRPYFDGADRIVTSMKGPIAAYAPYAWQCFEKVEPRARGMYPPSFGREPVLFLGQRRSPSGNVRLVVIASNGVNAVRLPNDIPAVVLPVPTIFETLPPPDTRFYAYAASGRYEPARLHPAVADPTDASHLTIALDVLDFDRNSVRNTGTLDVYLRDDDTLHWQVRDPASTKRAAPR